MSFGQGGPYGAQGDSGPRATPWGAPPQQPGQPGQPAQALPPQAPPVHPGPQPPLAQPPHQTPPQWPAQQPYPAAQQPPHAQPQAHPQGGTPDWAAMADTADRDRRRKWLLIGGGVLATAAVAAIVATAVVLSDKGDKNLPAAEKLPSASSGSPEPTFSKAATPPPNPREFISSQEKDTAPLTVKTLFPHSRPSLDKRVYQRAAQDTATDCASVAQGGLGQVLADNGCRQVLRSTYVRDGVAVTVGVAVFDTKAAADKAKEQSTGNIAPLTGEDAASFCQGTACRLSANAEGRYAYFTIAGFTNGSAVTSEDTKALQAGRDVAGYTFRRIMARANAQAAAAASPKPSGQPSGKPSAKPQA
ncbi:hypothetical protein [Streptomyces hesseae]|uniref:DUF4189 domain-containing protein n=1 Tax=Streptomyces hesseae TaxID=3075519 RepID=A0ABU2SIT9_9ACTN|nr:hypothetical protein [Streptomyces sp. DSM 40473]MDT0448883.1 hypothetical protein [Streptomyces sp. DSM 40473]